MDRFRTPLWSAILFFLIGPSVRGDEGAANSFGSGDFTVDIEPSDTRSLDFEWFPREAEFATSSSGEPEAILPGRTGLSVRGSIIVSGGESPTVARIDESGKFKIRIPITPGRFTVSIRLVDDFGKVIKDEMKFGVVANEKVRPFFSDIGSSLSYLSYKEDRLGHPISIDELGLTVKGNVGYRFDREWDFNANAFITAVPFELHSTQKISATRFYGLNARAGRMIYRGDFNTNLNLAFGWYVWGMIVSPLADRTRYGVNRVAGPQAFLIYRSKSRGAHAWYSYLKFAAIQDQSGFSLGNHEYAIGGGYQPWLGSDSSKSWFLTLDLATIVCSEFSLNSASLGISKRL